MAEKILIVEPHAKEAATLKLLLQKDGYEICGIATSATEAELMADSTTPDMVVLSYDLKNSITLARYLRKKNLPFIFISSSSEFFYNTLPAPFIEEHVAIISAVIPILARAIKSIRPGSAESSETDLQSAADFAGIVGKSPGILYVKDQIIRVAPYDTTVLIQGETGTGKEAVVNAIHSMSSRKTKPLIKINCAAIPASMVESQLFGHERGAFTGATDSRIGLFEQAQGGTIFLDEISEIPLEIQTKLLRVIQEKEIQRLGGRATIKTDVRIIVATNRNLQKEMASGNFRSDLYFRINVFPIFLPPLRERKEDIALLADHFLEKMLPPTKRLSNEALKQLKDYAWPGNIRELQHLIERTVLSIPYLIIAGFEMPHMEHEPGNIETKFETFEEVERNHILRVLHSCKGRINGKGGAAEILNLPPTTLNLKMKKLGIAWQYTYTNQ